ncbi:MAG: hypothetical protein ACRDRL_11500, partial [Sciscionella sp.]
NLVQTSDIGGGDLTIFLHHPIALVLFAITAILLVGPYLIRRINRARHRGSAREQPPGGGVTGAVTHPGSDERIQPTERNNR